MKPLMERSLEPHFFAAFAACDAAVNLLEILPHSDLMEELRNLIYVQHELFVHMIEGKHFGSNNIEDFIEYTESVQEEVKRLKDAP
jgi:hypothetical protein